jgi:hypothetical protein
MRGKGEGRSRKREGRERTTQYQITIMHVYLISTGSSHTQTRVNYVRCEGLPKPCT